MLYLGIDQHRKQLTVSVRNEAGDVTLRRQVSTEWDRVRAFFDELRQIAEPEGGFAAIVEVCGFNDWLLKMLTEYGCRETVLIQVEKRSKRKTDRRDAHQLSGTLWVNRHRLLAGQRVEGVRRIQPPTPAGGRRPATDGVAKTPGPTSHADDQQDQARAAKAQPRTRATGQGAGHQTDAEMAGDLAAGHDRPPGNGLAVGAVEAVGRSDCEVGVGDRKASSQERDGRRVGDDSRLRGLRQSGVGVADRLDRAVSAAGEFGELLGPDARLPQLGRDDRPTRLDHETRQRRSSQ